jgi:hypothetical protein
VADKAKTDEANEADVAD